MTGRKINEKGAIQIARDGGVGVAGEDNERCCCEEEECEPICIRTGDKQPDYFDVIISGVTVCSDGCHDDDDDPTFNSVHYTWRRGDINGHYRLKKMTHDRWGYCTYRLRPARALMEVDTIWYKKGGCEEEDEYAFRHWEVTDMYLDVESHDLLDNAYLYFAVVITVTLKDGHKSNLGRFGIFQKELDGPSCCTRLYGFISELSGVTECEENCYWRGPLMCHKDVSTIDIIPHCPP